MRQYMKRLLLSNKIQLCLLLILSMAALLLNISKTLYTGRYIDFLTNELSVTGLYRFVIILFVLGILGIIFNFLNAYYMAKIQTDIAFKINYDVLDYVKKLPLSFFDGKDSFYLNQRINSDSNVIVAFLMNTAIKLTTLLLSFITLFTILFRLNISVTCIILITIPIYLLLYNVFKSSLYKRTLEFKEAQNHLFSFMGKQFSNITYIKINSLYELLNKKLMDSYPLFLNSAVKYIKASILFSSTGSIIENIFNIFLFVFTGIEVLNNRMTIGEFIIIKGYYAMVMSSLGEFAGILKQIPDAKVAYNRLMEIINLDKEINGRKYLSGITQISGENVKLILHEKLIWGKLNFQFEKGNIYLIKGINGAGKSSLIKCILGLYMEEMEGAIKYNENSIENLDLYNIRKNVVAVVDQDAEFFFDSIWDNVSPNNESMNEKKMMKYFSMFGLQIEKSEVHRNSKHLSGGEKQKISIIKALLKEPEILILDEPTSALDTYSVDKLIEEINENKEHRITIVITHDERFVSIADKSVSMEKNMGMYGKHL